MMEYKVFNGKVVYFKNAIPNSKEIIDCIENTTNGIITDWVPWGNKYATSFEQQTSSMEYGIGKSIHHPNHDGSGKDKIYYWVFESLYKALEECSSIYKSIMNIDESVNPRLETPGFVIGKYDSGKGRDAHIDCPYDDLEHSYVMYLNDDYEGGELIFPELDIIFKPEAGSIVMFKSNDIDTIHEARAPRNGQKYIIPHFWRMGPSQGFIPWGTSLSDHIENISHNFEDLERVSRKPGYRIDDYDKN